MIQPGKEKKIFYLICLYHLIIWTIVPYFSNKNLSRWYEEISKRPAVIKGYDPENLGEKIPLVS